MRETEKQNNAELLLLTIDGKFMKCEKNELINLFKQQKMNLK